MKHAKLIFAMLIVVVAIAASVVWGLIIPTVRERHRNRCLSNLKMISGAIVNVALENRYGVGDYVPSAAVASFLIGNRLPTCPSGGTYVIGPVGKSPSCSFHGDLLGQMFVPVSDINSNSTKWFLLRTK